MPFTGDNTQDVLDWLAEGSPGLFDGATYVIDGSGSLVITDVSGDHNVWPIELNGAVQATGSMVGAADWANNHLKIPESS